MSTHNPDQIPDGLSPFEALLYHYATNPHTRMPNPLDLLNTTTTPHPTTEDPPTTQNTPPSDHAPANDDLPHVDAQKLAAFFFDLEIALLTAATPSTLTHRGGPPTPTTLEHRGSTTHPAANHPNLTLTIDHTTHPGTGQPQLRITLTRPTLLLATGHTTWQLTATLTHPNGTTTTHTTDPQTLTHAQAIWTIPHTPTTPTTLTHITLTPTPPPT